MLPCMWNEASLKDKKVEREKNDALQLIISHSDN